MEPLDILQDEFNTGENDANIKVYIFWGIDYLDKSDVGRWNSSELGKIVWDDEFTLAPETNQ